MLFLIHPAREDGSLDALKKKTFEYFLCGESRILEARLRL